MCPAKNPPLLAADQHARGDGEHRDRVDDDHRKARQQDANRIGVGTERPIQDQMIATASRRSAGGWRSAWTTRVRCRQLRGADQRGRRRVAEVEQPADDAESDRRPARAIASRRPADGDHHRHRQQHRARRLAVEGDSDRDQSATTADGRRPDLPDGPGDTGQPIADEDDRQQRRGQTARPSARRRPVDSASRRAQHRAARPPRSAAPSRPVARCAAAGSARRRWPAPRRCRSAPASHGVVPVVEVGHDQRDEQRQRRSPRCGRRAARSSPCRAAPAATRRRAPA